MVSSELARFVKGTTDSIKSQTPFFYALLSHIRVKIFIYFLNLNLSKSEYFSLLMSRRLNLEDMN